MFKKKLRQSPPYDVVKLVKSNNYRLLNKRAKSNQIVVIGDSIVELFPCMELMTGDRVWYNRGISGDSSDRLLERLDNNAISANPSCIVVLVGTNDIAFGRTDDQIVGSMRDIIDRIHDKLPECRVIIESIYPVNKTNKDKMVGMRTCSRIAELNAKIESLCCELSVEYLDFWSVLSDDNGRFDLRYTYDGLHPNQEGYETIAKHLLDYFSNKSPQ